MYGIFDHRSDIHQPVVPLPEKEKDLARIDTAWVKSHHKYIKAYPRIKRHYLEMCRLHKQLKEVAALLPFDNNDSNRLIMFKFAKDFVEKNLTEECHVICLTAEHHRGPDMRFIFQYHLAQTSAFIMSFSEEG